MISFYLSKFHRILNAKIKNFKLIFQQKTGYKKPFNRILKNVKKFDNIKLKFIL